jgi:hypothetical protein
VQEEKEALEDLSMELELADEDEPVLYVLPSAILAPSLQYYRSSLLKSRYS